MSGLNVHDIKEHHFLIGKKEFLKLNVIHLLEIRFKIVLLYSYQPVKRFKKVLIQCSMMLTCSTEFKHTS